MKSVYERARLTVTEFDTDDVIVTSGDEPVEEPVSLTTEIENAYRSFSSFNPGPYSWQ